MAQDRVQAGDESRLVCTAAGPATAIALRYVTFLAIPIKILTLFGQNAACFVPFWQID